MMASPASPLPEVLGVAHAGQDTGQAYNWGLVLVIVADLAVWAMVALAVWWLA